MPQTVRWEIPLKESHFIDGDGRKELGVDIIVAGRSKNGNYYSPEVAESFATHIMGRNKVHMDHRDDPQIRRFGRSLSDVAATVVESKGEAGKTVARLRMTNNPRTAWLYDMAKENPSDVHLSINASVKSAKGIAEDGKEANIVEEVLWSEVDFVGYGSAGGRVQQILASEGGLEIDDEDVSLLEGAKTLKGILDQRIKDQKVRDGWYDMWSAVRSMLSSIQTDESLDDKAKKTLVEKGMDEFKKKVQSFDLNAIYGKRGQGMYASVVPEYVADLVQLNGDAKENFTEEVLEAYQMAQGLGDVDWEAVEVADISEAKFSTASWAAVDKSSLPSSSFLIVGDKDKKGTWHLPYKDASGKVNLGALRAISVIIKSGQFRGQKLSFSIPQAVRTKIEGLLKSAKIGKYKSKKKESKGGVDMEKTEVLEALKANPEWIGDIPGVISVEKFTELKESLEKTERTLGEVKEQLDDEKLKRETAEKVQRINGYLKESSLTDDQVKDGFHDRLMGIEKDEDIKEAITKREALIKGVIEATGGRVEDNGPGPDPKSPEDGKKKAFTDEEAATALK